MVNNSQISLAFFAVRNTRKDDGFIGGILVTDKDGIPTEFRCTQPVRPTAPQKALYGNALEPHIFVNLCGIPLVKALDKKPDVCLVEDPVMLPIQSSLDFPVVHSQRIGEVLSADESFTDNSRRLDSPDRGFQPVVATFHEGYEQKFDEVKGVLEDIFTRIDLLEPFSRITTALEVLAERDDRFK